MSIIQTEPIDVAKVRAQVDSAGHGAVLVFEGVVRNHFDQRPVTGLEYEAYPELVDPVMNEILQSADAQWPGVAISVAHRVGSLAVGETSLVIAVGSAHRPPAYEASRFVLESIKDRLPVWKKEIYADGSAWKPNVR